MLFVVLALTGRACVFRPADSFDGAHFNRGTNAAWLDVDWVNEPKTPEQIAGLVRDLQAHQIRYAYVYVSYLKDSGSFNSTYAYAATFVRAVKAIDPALSVQAWIGLPVRGHSILASGGYVDLGNPSTRDTIAALCAQMTGQAGFDGVHLDPEPIATGDGDLLTLLDQVRQAIGPQATLSLAARHIQPVLPDLPVPAIDTFLWRGEYYRQVAARVDQIALMSYDSHLPLPQFYRLWVRFQVIGISNALTDHPPQILIGISPSQERTSSHWPSAENMTTGLEGIVDGLNDRATTFRAIEGVAIYAQWEASPADWRAYDTLWLGR